MNIQISQKENFLFGNFKYSKKIKILVSYQQIEKAGQNNLDCLEIKTHKYVQKKQEDL